MEILPFSPKFQKAVLELNELSVTQSEFIGTTVATEWHDDLQRIKETYLDNQGVFLLWMDSGTLFGMGGLERVDKQTANVKRIRVRPEYQHRGLAGEILAELEKQGRKLGYQRLTANTATGNLPAEKMFRTAGFKPVGEKPFFGVPCMVFEKKLNE